MKEFTILNKGYFPKELPPPFTTKDISENAEKIKGKWFEIYSKGTRKKDSESRSEFRRRRDDFISKYSASKCVEYSISKGKLSRRNLKIPNPKHFIKVSELISENWEDIIQVYKLSDFSTSYPVIEEATTKRAIRTYSKNVQDLRDKILETSVNKLFQVKLDISRFYPTIYTHVIAWSIIGKENAKNYYKKSKEELEALISSGDKNARLFKFADDLDCAVRACQDRQSIGVPIGPDTSHIISELIACRIDVEFKKKFEDIDVKACRYYDDYYIYVNSVDEADAVIKGIQKILNDFQLEINDKKVEVNEFPVTFENEWVTDIHRFEFNKTNVANSIKHYFSLIWGIGEKNYSRTDWIFKYALRTFEIGTTEIPKRSWKIFENLILKTALIQPAILDIVTRIFLSYQSYLDSNSKEKIKNLIFQVIKNHSPINHNFETAWALWLANSFDIELNKEIANIVIQSEDNISLLILLYMDKEKGLINGKPDYTSLENELKEDILFSENWLLAYQGVKNKWLSPKETDLFSKNEFINILLEMDVNFVDFNLQLEIYKQKEKCELPESYISESSIQNNFSLARKEKANQKVTEKIKNFPIPVSNLN